MFCSFLAHPFPYTATAESVRNVDPAEGFPGPIQRGHCKTVSESSYPLLPCSHKSWSTEYLTTCTNRPQHSKHAHKSLEPFYPRTRVHLFRCVNCHDPDGPRLFKMGRESPELLQHIKCVEFQCLDYFLPNCEMSTIELMRSLSSSATLPLDEGRRNDEVEKECRWVDMLPTFVSSAPYLAITRLELLCPRLHNFLELHTVVLSLPNVTELSIDVLTMSHLGRCSHPYPPKRASRSSY